jgi:DNA-binding PadR family transcriptional regulator
MTDPHDLLPLPPLSLYLLLALAEGPAHGWAVIKRIRALTEGRSDPSSGSLYLAMIRLEEQGLVEETTAPRGEESTDARRRYHRLTAFGRKVLRAETDRLAALVEHARAHRIAPLVEDHG